MTFRNSDLHIQNLNYVEVSWTAMNASYHVLLQMEIVVYFAYHTPAQGVEGGEKVHQSNDCGKFPL